MVSDRNLIIKTISVELDCAELSNKKNVHQRSPRLFILIRNNLLHLNSPQTIFFRLQE